MKKKMYKLGFWCVFVCLIFLLPFSSAYAATNSNDSASVNALTPLIMTPGEGGVSGTTGIVGGAGGSLVYNFYDGGAKVGVIDWDLIASHPMYKLVVTFTWSTGKKTTQTFYPSGSKHHYD